jgi:hypothetical protein
MKRVTLLSLFVCTLSSFLFAQSHLHPSGTIVRMRMAPCLIAPRSFMAALSGSSRQQETGELCPEYVLVSDKVVYVIVGKTSGALVPLAETTVFRLQKNELLIRVDDAKHETRFSIREMVLRSEWERVHPNVVEGAGEPRRHSMEAELGVEIH